MSGVPVLDAMLEARLEPAAARWLRDSAAAIAAGEAGAPFAGRISVASRHVPESPLAPAGEHLAGASAALPGWNPERWTQREAARVRLVLARPDQDDDVFVRDLEDAFRYADEGELRALYKSLCLLPGGERFAWRAGEGCRTNIVPVFESVACDNPYPARWFDELAFRQLAIKAVFVGAPLWRVWGLDGRLDEELARMALDLADERRSAGRPVQPELWLCLGTHGGERALASLEKEIASGDTMGRRAAAVALARAGRSERLAELADREADPAVAPTMRAALEGPTDSSVFRAFET